MDFCRRHSFGDLSTFRDMRVLSAERMRIDVELCGQLLVLSRRQEHLQNILACLQVNLIDHIFLYPFMLMYYSFAGFDNFAICDQHLPSRRLPIPPAILFRA